MPKLHPSELALALFVIATLACLKVCADIRAARALERIANSVETKVYAE